MIRYIHYALCLFLLVSCSKQQCIEANDNLGVSVKGQFELSARGTVPFDFSNIEGASTADFTAADFTYEGEIYMNCESQKRTVTLCGPGCTPSTGPFGIPVGDQVDIVDDTWTSMNQPLGGDNVVLITGIQGSWSVNKATGNKECMLSANTSEGGVCQSSTISDIKINAKDVDSGNTLDSYQTGQGDDTVIVINEEGLGLTEMEIRLTHDDENGNTVVANPANPQYLYVGSFDITYNLCTGADLKTNGDCVDDTTPGSVIISDEVGGACDGDGLRDNNYGSYTVKYEASSPKNQLGSIFSTMISNSKELFFGVGPGPDGIIGRVYTAIISDTNFQRFVYGMATIAIIFIGYGYISGVSQMEYKELLLTFLRMSVMFTLLTEEGFTFFWANVITIVADGVPQILNIYVLAFDELVTTFRYVQPTVSGTGTVISNVTPNMESYVSNGDWSDIFAFFDLIFNLFIQEVFWIKIFSLYFAMPFDILGAPIALVFTILAMLIFVLMLVAMVQLVLSVLSSFVILAITISLMPVLLIMWQFSRTRSSFTDVMIPYIYLSFLLPLFTVIGGCIMSMLLYISIVNLISFSVCKACIAYINIFNIFGFCLLSFFAPEGTDIAHSVGYRLENFPISFGDFLFFLSSLFFLYKSSSFLTGLSYELSQARVYSSPVAKIEQNVMSAASSSGSAIKDAGYRAQKLAGRGKGTKNERKEAKVKRSGNEGKK